MRNFVLVSYDIVDPKRLRKVFRLLRGNGDRFQDSVFLCQINVREEEILRGKLDKLVNKNDDQIVMIRLGGVLNITTANPDNWTVIGKKPRFSDNSIMVY
jgi:CRISPR-associated protein Cas2